MEILTKLLEFRGAARRVFQKYQLIIEPVFRFLVAYIAFHTINETLPYNSTVAKPVIELGMAAVGAFLPSVILLLMCALLAILQVYSASPILAALAIVIFAVLYCFVARFSGKYGYAIVGVPVLFTFNMPYLIPLLLGMAAGPISVFPTAAGVIIYYVFKVITEAAKRQDITSLDATLALYIDVVNNLFKNKEMFITVGVFTVVIIVMYLVRRLRFEFVFEITIVLGAVLNILGFLLADLKFNINVQTGSLILGTILSTLIVFAAQFFRMVLDYMSVENVQFEDDDYYYYVKAVPKIDVSMLQKNVTTFSMREETEAETTTAKEPEEEEDFGFEEATEETNFPEEGEE